MYLKIIINILLILNLTACVKSNKQEKYWSNIDLYKELGFTKKTLNTKSYTLFSYNFDHCFMNIYLFKDSTFEFTRGCDNFLYIINGNWEIKNDSLFFKTLPYEKWNLLNNYYVKNDLGQNCVIIIKNKFNKSLSNFRIIAFDTTNNFILDRLIYLCTDKNGVIKFQKNQFDSISITEFKEITNKYFTLKQLYFPDTLFLEINTTLDTYNQHANYETIKGIHKYKLYNNKTKLLINNFELIKQK